MAWAGRAQAAIVDMGSPVSYSMTLPGGDKAHSGAVGGFSILQAESADALRAVLDGHPHFHAPGASIEVHELLPLPGM